MLDTTKKRWALRRLAEQQAYAQRNPEVREELRKCALGSLVPLVRTAEQAAMGASVLAATALAGASSFVPMCSTTLSSSHQPLALLGWAGLSMLTAYNLIAAAVQLRKLENLEADDFVVSAHLETCVGLAHPWAFATMIGTSVFFAYLANYMLTAGSDPQSFFLPVSVKEVVA